MQNLGLVYFYNWCVCVCSLLLKEPALLFVFERKLIFHKPTQHSNECFYIAEVGSDSTLLTPKWLEYYRSHWITHIRGESHQLQNVW